MISMFALLTNLLLASMALAVRSSSRLEARLARRSGNRQSMPINRVDVSTGAVSNAEHSSNWAGAVWTETGGTFTTVTGAFTVPTSSGSDGSASAWVGIDGDSCGNAILQTGVDFTISGGVVSYAAWYEWYPDHSYDFGDITISAGNQIKATVTASSTTSGTAVIENLTTGKKVTQEISSSSPLCEKDAEWMVEGGSGALADFGTVTFTSATASGSGGSTYAPGGAAIWNIEQNNKILTSVSTSGNTLTINYVQTV